MVRGVGARSVPDVVPRVKNADAAALQAFPLWERASVKEFFIGLQWQVS